MSVGDAGIAAVLEIPPAAFQSIKAAQDAINALGKTSWDTAHSVRTHWGVTAVEGLEKFIKKVKEAQTEIGNIKGGEVRLNTTTAQQQLKNVATDVREVSETVQKVASMPIDFNNLNGSAKDLKLTFGEIEAIINRLKKERWDKPTESDSGQKLTNLIEKLKEYLNLKKKSEEQIADKKRAETDTKMLSDQKALLSQMLSLKKSINAQSLQQEKTKSFGGTVTADDIKKLEGLRKQLADVQREYAKVYKTRIEGDISAKAAQKFDNERATYKLKALNEEYNAQVKLNQAQTRSAELKTTSKLRSGMGSSDEATYQRLINGYYQEQLRIQKEIGKVKVSAANEGRSLSSVESGLVENYRNRLVSLGQELRNISGVYKELNSASKKVFQNNWSENNAKIAVQIEQATRRYAESEQKAAEAAQKKAEAERKSIAQQEAKQEQSAITELASLYTKKLNLLKSIESQNTKITAEQRDATDAEKQRWSVLNAQMQTVDKTISDIAKKYPQLAAAAKSAFDENKAKAMADENVRLSEAINRAAEAAQHQAKNTKELLDLRNKAHQLNAEIQQQVVDLNRAKQAAKDAETAYKNWWNVHPAFNLFDAEKQLRSLEQRINDLKSKAATQGPTKASITLAAVPALQREYDALKATMTELNNLDSNRVQKLNELFAANNKYAANVSVLDAELKKNAKEIENVEKRAEALNREFAKGNTTSSLVTEYANLTKKLQTVNKAMNDFQAAGGKSTSEAYKKLESEIMSIMARRKEIEKLNIAEVAQYRQQMALSAAAAELSAFVQNEAQMTAEAKKQARQRALDRLENYKQSLNTYAGAMRQYNMLGTGGSAYADTYENRARVIKNLEAAIKSLDKADADYKKHLDELTTALKKLKAAQKEVESSMKQSTSKPLVTPQDAINAAKSATTLKELQAAYKQLKEVMANTNPKTDAAAWAQMRSTLLTTKNSIDAISKSMGELSKQSSRLGNVMNQMRNKIALVFSVSAIQGYINKLIETRAQFELQNVALRAILQNKEEADRIFMQVQQMALQSPFTIMQLTTYTKQLAAYRIEAEKLVGTTKMLADVSAGLGVDMSRLILAYGQVKAANYLRACLGFGTPVMLYDGTFKKVEDVAVGDMLMGDDEKPRYVSKLYQGEQMMYHVIYDGGKFRCNEHHILTVYDALNECVTDIFVLDYLKEPHRYQGVKRENGRYKTFTMKVERDRVDTYYGFSIDGNHRFIIQDNIVTHNTEVRQFTEAGLNIAGELATYFTELQGKMVSVGDVMDMITKRMVRFEDVEEVFKRVTSAGGLFYDMQRKQSETLHGQLQRITDAISLMMNEIGQSNQGAIAWLLSAIRSMINSWRTIAAIIKPATFAFGSFMLVGRWIPTLITGLRTLRLQWIAIKYATQSATAAQMAYNTAAKANVYGAIAAAIVGLISAIYECVTAQDALTESLNRIQDEGMSDMYGLIVRYRELADVVTSSTTAYEERKEALEELQRVYKGVLPDTMLEIENIRMMKDGYKEATDAISTYSLAKIRDTAKNEVENKRATQFKEWKEQFTDDVDSFKRWNTQLNIIPDSAIQAAFDHILDTIYVEIQNGETKIEDARDRFVQMVERHFNIKEFKFPSAAFKEQIFNVKDINSSLVTLYDVFGGLNARTEVLFKNLEASTKYSYFDVQDAQSTIEKYDRLKKAVDEYAKAIQNVAELNQKGLLYDEKGEPTADGAVALRDLDAAMQTVSASADSMSFKFIQSADAIVNGTKTALATEETLANVFNLTLKKALDTYNVWGRNLVRNDYFRGWVEEQNRYVKKLDFSPLLQTLQDYEKTIAKSLGATPAIFNELKTSSNSTRQSIVEDVKKLIEAKKAEINAYEIALNKAKQLGLTTIILNQYMTNLGFTKPVEEIKTELTGLQELLSAFGGEEKKKSGKSKADKELKKIQDLKKALEDCNKLYEDLHKNESVADANANVLEKYSKVFQRYGVKIGDYFKNGTYDAESLANALEVLINRLKQTTNERKEFAFDTSRQIEDLRFEPQKLIDEQKVRDFQNAIEDMFANLELSKELAKLGIDIDLSYAVGGKPMTMADIEKFLNEQFKTIETLSESHQKILRDARKKFDDLEDKDQKERLKNYIKYLKESLSERAQIQLQAAMDIQKIRNDSTLDEFSQEQAISQRRKKEQEDLMKLEFDALKGTDTYISVMKDVANASAKELRFVKERLLELKSTFDELPPEAMKAVTEAMKNIDKALAKKSSKSNFFKDLRTMMSYQRNEETLKSNRAESESYLSDLERILGDEQKKLAEIELKLRSIPDKMSDEYAKATEELASQKLTVTLLKKQIAELKNKIAELTGAINDGDEATDNVNATLKDVQDNFNAIIDSVGVLKDGLDSCGLMTDSLSDAFESLMGVAGGVNDVMSGISGLKDADPAKKVAGAIQAIGGLFKIVGGIFAIGDKKKEREIRKLQSYVEGLTKTYEKLGKAIEAAYSFAEYNSGYKQAQLNLQQQRKSYQSMIALEQSKKKSDADKIQEYKDALDEIAEKEEELHKQRLEAYGSTTDVFSEANDYVSAWLEAYKQTGDGLDALIEKWDEFFEGLVMKQAASSIVSKRLKTYIDRLNNAIDSGMTGLDLSKVFAQIGTELKDDMVQWNDDLKQFFDAVGIGSTATSSLSELQKGIQNITEPQAAAIEAYLNSIRAEVYHQSEQLESLIAAVASQYSVSDSPILSEVKSIRSLLQSIDNRIASVITTKVGTGSIIRIG